MEYIIGIIVALLGGVFYFKKKADNKAVEAKLAHTKGRDKELSDAAADLKKQIAELDAGIERARKEREARKERDKNMTLAERRKRIKEGLDD